MTRKVPTTFAEFWPDYLNAHADSRTRLLHFAGTSAGLCFAASFLVTGEPQWAAAALLTAYGAAWIGHALFERNVPTTFSHPIWSLRGDFRMLRLALAGTLDDEAAKIVVQPSDGQT